MKPSKAYHHPSLISIIDKKQWLTKVSEPSENYLHLLIDSLMYAKHKILCGHGMDSGLADFLRKVKAGLLKVVQCPDFLNKTIAGHASPGELVQMLDLNRGSSSPGRERELLKE